MSTTLTDPALDDAIAAFSRAPNADTYVSMHAAAMVAYDAGTLTDAQLISLFDEAVDALAAAQPAK